MVCIGVKREILENSAKPLPVPSAEILSERIIPLILVFWHFIFRSFCNPSLMGFSFGLVSVKIALAIGRQKNPMK
jgi:hypothetical protein